MDQRQKHHWAVPAIASASNVINRNIDVCSSPHKCGEGLPTEVSDRGKDCWTRHKISVVGLWQGIQL